MGRGVGRASLATVGVLAVLVSVSAAEPPKRLKLAQDLARAHAAWPQGRDWLQANLARASELVVPVLGRCTTASSDAEVTAFSVYLKLSQTGRILDVVTDVDPRLDRCLLKESRDVTLPEAPREDFWIQVNLAAPL
jgi:hypothetical protein